MSMQQERTLTPAKQADYAAKGDLGAEVQQHFDQLFTSIGNCQGNAATPYMKRELDQVELHARWLKDQFTIAGLWTPGGPGDAPPIKDGGT